MRPYGAIGAQPWTGPWDTTPRVHGEDLNALSTPLALGPGWYKGFRVAFDPSQIIKVNPMRSPLARRRARSSSYGFIGNTLGPPMAILPVRPPIGGTQDPHGPVYAAPYIPSGLPVIRPSPGWYIGPQVYSDVPLGTVYGDPELPEAPAPQGEPLSLGKVIGGGAVALAVGGGVGALVGIALTMGYLGAATALYPEGKRSKMGERLADIGMYATFGGPILLGLGYASMVTYAGYKKYLAGKGAA